MKNYQRITQISKRHAAQVPNVFLRTRITQITRIIRPIRDIRVRRSPRRAFEACAALRSSIREIRQKLD